MTPPTKCPKCGQPMATHSFTQCVVDQRDALAARVKELEEELEGHAWEINPAMYEGAIEGHLAKIAKLEAKVKELEEALGLAIEMRLNWLGIQDEGYAGAYYSFVKGQDEDWEIITKAKESKP